MSEHTGHILSIAEIDRELAERERETATAGATLVELDKHPGLVMLRRFPPSGVTAERWTVAEAGLHAMWEDYGRLGTILEQVQAARARRRHDALDREELTRLLRGNPLEVSRNTIPMAQRSLLGPREEVSRIGIAELLDRMRVTFPRVVAVLDAVDAVNSRVMSDLAPLQTELDRVGTGVPELRGLASDIAELSRLAVTDPLSLTPAELDSRIGDLSARMRDAAAVRAELTAMAADWPGAIAHLRTLVEALRKTRDRAEHARAEVERTILAAPLPRHTDDSTAFSAELTALEANPPAPDALWELRRRLTEALDAAGRNERLAQGLLDRRAELGGRLTGYRAKAARLGLGEDRDILASGRIAAGLLTRRPCDLAAVTRAITDYRQLIAQKTGRRT